MSERPLAAVAWRLGRNFGAWHFVRPASWVTLCGADIPVGARITKRPAKPGDPECSRCAAVHHHEMMKLSEVKRG